MFISATSCNFSFSEYIKQNKKTHLNKSELSTSVEHLVSVATLMKINALMSIFKEMQFLDIFDFSAEQTFFLTYYYICWELLYIFTK